MPRSHASTGRSRSRSPSRRAPTRTASRRAPSTTSTKYEVDFDALRGPDSTGQDTSDVEDDGLRKFDTIRSDDIDGPEDFTLNMEYWMKTPLPLLLKQPEVRVQEATEELDDDATREGDRAISNVYDEEEPGKVDSRSPTLRAPAIGSEDERPTDIDESTMEQDEKVMSYLDALPDTDIGDAVASTPHYKAGTLRRQRPQQTLPHSPSPAPQKTRSLQPTVEDSTDTPRKVTQETVVHYQTEQEQSATNNSIFRDIADLEARLKDQESAAQNRIAELETIITYTRSEMETIRDQNFKKSEEINELKDLNEMLGQSVKASSADTNNRLDALREEYEKRIQSINAEHVKENDRQVEEVNEAWRRKLKKENETYAKAKDEEFVRRETHLKGECDTQLRALREEKDSMSKELRVRDQQITELQHELSQSRNDTSVEMAKVMEEQKSQFDGAKVELNEKITTLESRIEKLISDLKAATDDATKTRLETNDYATLQETSKTQAAKITLLESRLQTLQTQLDSSRADVSTKDQEILRSITEQERMDKRFTDTQARISDLEKTISTLRQDLTQSRTETDGARKEIQRAHEGTRVVRESLREARAETEANAHEFEEQIKTLEMHKRDVGRMLENAQNERDSLASSQKSQLSEMRTKAEEAVRKVGVMLDAERVERKKAAKEAKALKVELEQLRGQAQEKKARSEKPSPEAVHPDGVYSTEAMSELETLREIIRKQNVTNKAAKAEAQAARAELESLKADMDARTDEFLGANGDMNERFAALLKPLMREKTKSAMETRDGKWIERLGKLQAERELMGKVLMREWGKQECGRAKKDELQYYRYHYDVRQKQRRGEGN